jgi:2-polyprenyl-6-methoxyphenol hydroxylase-like FAD-dependent oxidoreductase
MPYGNVAVIGAGPGGLVAARYLRSEGFEPVVFEEGAKIGGPSHTAAMLFARAAGVEPELGRWPELARPLLFGPLSPMSFRMSGRDSIPDAPARFSEDVRAFGCMPSNGLTPMQIGQLQALAGACGNETFQRYVETVIAAQ